MNNQIVTVNLTPGGSAPAVVRVSQGDIGRPILFKVLDGTSQAGLTHLMIAKVEGTKPSGLGFSVTGTISGNTVAIETTEAMTQEAGSIWSEIRFTMDNIEGEDPDDFSVGTANFILYVEPETHNASTTDGTYETMADLEARVAALESGQSGTGLTDEEKALILDLFAKAAYADDDAALSYDELAALWTIITRSVLLSLTHVTSSNTSASVEDGASYTTTLTADTDYTINSVTVTMGGVDITSTAYSSGTVTIAEVTGNIVITATATPTTQYTWLYESSSGTKLSAESTLVKGVLQNGTPTETLTGGNLNVNVTGTNGYYQYELLPDTTTDAVLVVKARCNTLPTFVSALCGMRLLLSNGTSGANMAIDSAKIRYGEGSTVKAVDFPTGFDFTQWHVYKLELTSTGHQIGYIDDVQMFDSTTLSTSYSVENRLAFIKTNSGNATNCDIEYVGYIERST